VFFEQSGPQPWSGEGNPRAQQLWLLPDDERDSSMYPRPVLGVWFPSKQQCPGNEEGQRVNPCFLQGEGSPPAGTAGFGLDLETGGSVSRLKHF